MVGQGHIVSPMPSSSVVETGPQQWRKYESADVLGGAEDFKPIEFLAFSMEFVEIRMNVVED